MAGPGSPAASDVDRKALRALAMRFRAAHAQVWQQVRARLPVAARDLMDTLPVLLHSNHAALPGFIDFDTPAGIDGFSPDHEAILAARKLALSYTYERFKVRATTIASVIVEPRATTEMAVWVITPLGHHEALAPKLAAITRHAARLDLTLDCRLLDALDSRAGRACALGDTPKLALDSLYRHGIVVAGRYPIWWLVPSMADDDYRHYCERLRQQRFIGTHDTFDLGPAAPSPQRNVALPAPRRWPQHCNRPIHGCLASPSSRAISTAMG
ncbi:MAG: hypothetical protein HC809_15320 [Gammaproteobacteria bacterium]|nr:hypothetical protein [Gammaproteobacteria bacterium]